MYYKNITLFIFLILIATLSTAAIFPNPTTGLILMLLMGFLVIYQTFAVLKGPKVKENSNGDQWYEHD
jgi:hypothetical protein